MIFESIKELIELIDNSELTELEMECGNVSLKIKKNEEKSSKKDSITPPKPSLLNLNYALEESALDRQSLESYITSPVVGIYYLSHKVTNRPFVKLGDKVKKGDVVCLIEILNIIYEVKSEIEGQVVEILATNGCMVEYGQKLLKIRF